jgi:hypothetical protein
VLRVILSHCGVQEVRLIPSDLRALPANFLRVLLLFYAFKSSYKKTSPAVLEHFNVEIASLCSQ